MQTDTSTTQSVFYAVIKVVDGAPITIVDMFHNDPSGAADALKQHATTYVYDNVGKNNFTTDTLAEEKKPEEYPVGWVLKYEDNSACTNASKYVKQINVYVNKEVEVVVKGWVSSA